eukprot:3650129-Lingulodinium_polyedra.AAC.1
MRPAGRSSRPPARCKKSVAAGESLASRARVPSGTGPRLPRPSPRRAEASPDSAFAARRLPAAPGAAAP